MGGPIHKGNRAANAAEYLRKLEHGIDDEQRRTPTTLNNPCLVMQKLEREQLRTQDQQDDAAVPGVTSQTEAIQRKSALQDPEDVWVKHL